jgi:hypothetical protein
MYRRQQWVVWRHELRDGERTKVLYNAHTGGRAKVSLPDTWTTYEHARSVAASGNYAGIGYVFAADDPFTCIDLDHCRNPETGAIAPWAMEIISAFASYAEPSAGSGKGVHIIGYGKKIHDRCRNWKHEHGTQIEVYEHGRFLTMSEQPLPGCDAIRDIQGPLDTFIAEHWTRHLKPVEPARTGTYSVSLASDEIITTAHRISPGFTALYDSGDTGNYGGDHSAADLALCSKLAWFTKDPAQILEIWKSSALYRAKTDRKDYTDRTITKAIEGVGGSQYDPNYANHTPCPGHGVPVADGTDVPVDPATAAEYWKARALRAEERVEVLLERVRRADAREEIYRNTKLGAPRQVAVTLAQMFHDDEPAKPDDTLGYRLPLARLARETGQSEDTCSRQLKQLATYRDAEGKPIFHVETVDIPRSVNQETGEIIEPHKEIWGGPAVPRKEFMNVMASLAPKEAPKHGGKPDRNGCPNHPNAGVIRRTRTTLKITHECAECHMPLHTETQPVGYEEVEIIPAVIPTQHDAFEQVATSDHPTQHDAVCTSNHSAYKQPSMMPDRSPVKVDDDSDRPQFWVDRVKRPRRQQPNQPLVSRCDWHLGEGETCGEPTEDWETGYGSQTLCHRHASEYRSRGRSSNPGAASRVVTTSRVSSGMEAAS